MITEIITFKLRPGMTREEVRSEIGSPNKTVALQPQAGVAGGQTVEVWEYDYSGSGVEAGEVVAALALVFAVGALVVLSGGHGGGGGMGGLGGGGGSSAPSRWKFSVGFGEDGKVRNVSVLEPMQK